MIGKNLPGPVHGIGPASLEAISKLPFCGLPASGSPRAKLMHIPVHFAPPGTCLSWQAAKFPILGIASSPIERQRRSRVKCFLMVLLKDTLRQHLEKVFANQELAQWFDPLAIAVDEDKKLIRVSFPHAFFGQWFMKARRNVFERQLSPFINDMRIVYEGGGDGFNGKKDGPHSPAGKPDVRALSGTSSFIRPAEVPVSEQFGKTEVLADDHTRLSTRSARFLLEHHRFETFIGNRKNDFPLAAAHQAVEKALSPSYTPFVIQIGRAHV